MFDNLISMNLRENVNVSFQLRLEKLPTPLELAPTSTSGNVVTDDAILTDRIDRTVRTDRIGQIDRIDRSRTGRTVRIGRSRTGRTARIDPSRTGRTSRIDQVTVHAAQRGNRPCSAADAPCTSTGAAERAADGFPPLRWCSPRAGAVPERRPCRPCRP